MRSGWFQNACFIIDTGRLIIILWNLFILYGTVLLYKKNTVKLPQKMQIFV